MCTGLPGSTCSTYRVVTLSPDQINIRLGQLEAQKSFLQTIGSYTGDGCDIQNQVDGADTAYNDKTGSLENNGTAVMTKRCKCLVAGGNTDNEDCQGFQGALDLTLENAQEVAFQYQGRAALKAVQSGNKDAVNAMIRGIDAQIAELTDQLQNSPSVLSDVGDASEQIAGNAPSAPWLYFSWNSEESQRQRLHLNLHSQPRPLFRLALGSSALVEALGTLNPLPMPSVH